MRHLLIREPVVSSDSRKGPEPRELYSDFLTSLATFFFFFHLFLLVEG